MRSRLRIVVLGIMGRCPFGGVTWQYLNWLRALSRLGHEVWYVEDDLVWPYDPEQECVTDDCQYAVRLVSTSLDRIGLSGHWAYRLADRGDACWGVSESRLRELYASCDALLNIVGATDLREEHLAAPMRIYVQTDPVSSELRLANGDAHTREAFENHHVIATYGENYGAGNCGVPLNGIGSKYRKTRQPIDTELWPMAYDAGSVHFTTIGNYRQDGNDVEYQGEIYRWSKHYEWEKFLDLPMRTRQPFELAMMPDAATDREKLIAHGWHLTPPIPMSLDVFGEYSRYFRRSRAAFTVAKDQNVRLRSGWFSDREACYLASGKPVVTQETGFSQTLPTGEGLFGVNTIEEALGAIEVINSDYERHCRAAREIALEYFAAEKVAGRLLQDVGLS